MARLEECSLRMPYLHWLSEINSDGQTIVRHFIQRNDWLDRVDFEHRIEHMYLNIQPKPRHWHLISKILICINTEPKEHL